jgi:hypothetical protein
MEEPLAPAAAAPHAPHQLVQLLLQGRAETIASRAGVCLSDRGQGRGLEERGGEAEIYISHIYMRNHRRTLHKSRAHVSRRAPHKTSLLRLNISVLGKQWSSRE